MNGAAVRAGDSKPAGVAEFLMRCYR